jgi:16S rRNA processing protein RimM
VVVGRFGRPQGLKGFIRVISFTEPEESIFQYSPWYKNQDDQWVPIPLENQVKQNNTLLVKVAGFEQREQLATLTHTEIYVARSQLPVLPEGEFYWQDMINMQVFTRSGPLLGEVTSLLSTGSNDVLVVCGEKRHLIPYIKGLYILSVDPVQRKMRVDWDEDF